MAKNDAKFLRVKNDPVAATALPTPVVSGDTEIHYGMMTGIVSSGDGAEWDATTEQVEFLTDKRIHLTVIAAYVDISDPAWIQIQQVIPEPYTNAFYNGLYVTADMDGYPGPTVSWTATIDLPADAYTFKIIGRADNTLQDINVNWNMIAVNHTYVPGGDT